MKKRFPDRRKPAILQIKTILSCVQRFAGFVYRRIHLQRREQQPIAIDIFIKAHARIRGHCSHCQLPAPGYDHLPVRRRLFVPLWGIPTYFHYAPHRVQCPAHRFVVEPIPWSDRKQPFCRAMMSFPAR